MAFAAGEPEVEFERFAPALWLVLWGLDGNPLSQVAGAYLSHQDAIDRARMLIESGATNVRLGELVELGDGLSGSNFKVWSLSQLPD